MRKIDRLIGAGLCALLCTATVQAQSGWQMKEAPIQTRWAKEVSPANALPAYPRPQMVREKWNNLNGLWKYAITAKDAAAPSAWQGEILVPYPVESALSGVKRVLQPTENLWYKRSFARPECRNGEKVLMHFGAVDYKATVFVNGQKIGEHEGGYTAFSFDVTAALRAGDNEVLVQVYDPTDQGVGPHGKQVLNPQSIYYTGSSGIWQTVWLEVVPARYIDGLQLTPDIDKGVLAVKVKASAGATVELTALAGETVVSHARGPVDKQLTLSVPNAKLWSPDAPYLYDLTVRLVKGGKTIDEVKSYFGMRKISVAKDSKGVERIFLNNHPYFNLGTLDQGFWPDGLYTAPTDEALAYDIRAIKHMGFNTIRKHIKIEPARWYYYTDKLGMLVWQDMVNPNQGIPEGAKAAFEKQSAETVAQLYNYPSITTWVLFNEGWGTYDQPRLTSWLKGLDRSRIVNGHTGENLHTDRVHTPDSLQWKNSDMTDIHAYPPPAMPPYRQGQAKVLGEFGGIGTFIPDHQWITGSAWGYVQEKPASLQAKYRIMTQHLRLLEERGLSASIYTQPFDVEGEQNGLMTYDRAIIKIPFDTLVRIHAPLNPQMGILPAVVAENADLTEPGIRYSQLLEEYVQGKRDPAFLKRLSLMASQSGDKEGGRLATDAYISTLRAPYAADDLQYVVQVTTSVKDKGFALIQSQAASINQVLGPRQAEVKMMNTIYGDVIAPHVSGPDAKPDWDMLSAAVAPYGDPGQEILARAQTFHYLNHQDWPNFVRSADAYIAKCAAAINPNEMNEWAWTTFQQVKDPALLLRAVEWSKRSVQDRIDPNFLDTQANLLYKAGKKAEGLAIEEKAVSMSGSAELKATLEKMKAGQPTWQ